VTEVTAELRRPTLDVCPPEGRRCWSEDRRRASEDMRLIREVRARSRCESAVGAQYVTSSSESLGLLASPRPLRSARRPKATALALRSAVRSPPEGDRASAATDAHPKAALAALLVRHTPEGTCRCLPEAGESLPDGHCPWAAPVSRRCCLSRS